MWATVEPTPGTVWYVRYTRPSGQETRLGPMTEDSARGMVSEYSRSQFALSPVLEEWAPVRAWRREG